MSYLYLINSLQGGGAERVLQVLANHQVAEEPVTIITLEDPKPDYPFDSRIQIRRLLPLPDWKWLRDLVLPIQFLALCFLFWKLRPRFCFSLLVRSNFLNSLAGRLFPNVRTCISEHAQSTAEFSGDSLRTWVVVALIRQLYPLASDVFCTCEGVKTCLESIGVRHPRTFVIPNPIELSGVGPVHYQANKEPSEDYKIVTIGRLIPQKDHETLLRAFGLVASQVPCQLHIVGVGPLGPELQNLAKSLNLEHRVFLRGWIDDVFSCLKNSDLFALSSRWEGFGNVLVEAMACGLPVVSTECDSGPAEVLGHGRFGRLVPVGDAAEMAEALLELLRSPDLRLEYSQRSLLRAAHYSVTRVARVYRDLLIHERADVKWYDE